MASMKEHVANLMKLVTVTDKEEFVKDPQGYNKRNDACLIQLGTHKSAAVRLAVAKLPLLRDKFVLGMFPKETNKEVKAALEPKYLAACTKQDRFEDQQKTIKSQKNIIAELRKELNKK